MVAIITANNRASRDSVAPPPSLKDDGTPYAWRMFFENNRIIADSDNLDELIELLLPGYVSLTDEPTRLEARSYIAHNVQIQGKANILADLTQEQINDLKEWEINVLEWASEDGIKSDPYGWGDGTGTLGETNNEALDIWTADVPLLLVDTSYAPYTDVPAPLSKYGDYIDNVANLYWIRAASEETLLRTLSKLGFITFGKPGPAPRMDPKALPDDES